MKPLLIVLGIVALIYAGICAVLYFNQDRMLFFPQHASMPDLEALARQQGFEPWTNASGERIGWKSTTGDPTNALLILHGNGGFALGRNYARMRGSSTGFQVYLLEYPGYGARLGKPSAQSLVSAALDAIDTLRDNRERRIWLMGQSLGSGVACACAVARPLVISGMILVTPFDSLSSAASSHYPWIPVRLLLRHQLDSDKNLETYHGPIAFVVAANDTIIPAKYGRRLYDRYAGPKRLWLIPRADHNDFEALFADWSGIESWLLDSSWEARIGK